VRVERRNHEQRRNDETPKNVTLRAREGNVTVELPKSKAPVVSTRKEGDGNTEKALGRSGGVYVPPFKLAQMMKDLEDKSSLEYQRMSWDALRKSINGLVNKVNASNIKNIIPELFAENLIRGRGLFCRSCM
jgi:pre-mRNA-splicing factor CWC22